MGWNKVGIEMHGPFLFEVLFPSYLLLFSMEVVPSPGVLWQGCGDAEQSNDWTTLTL